MKVWIRQASTRLALAASCLGALNLSALILPGVNEAAAQPGGDSSYLSSSWHDQSAGYSESLGWECPQLVSDREIRQIPQVPIPGYLESYEDPAFGTKVTRITGAPGSNIPTFGGQWGSIARHYYSKDPAWNADQSLLVIKKNLEGGEPGWPTWIFLDGESYGPVFAKASPKGSDALWHPTQPDWMVFLGSDDVGMWNVRTGEVDVRGTFPGYSIQHLSEWNPSLDGRWVAVAATVGGDQVAFAYDMQERQKGPDIDLNGVDIDWVSISPLGTYVVLNGAISGGSDQTQVYDRDGTKVGPLWHEYGRPSHADLTLDDQGEEVAVGVAKTTEDGHLIKRRLRDGQVSVLVDVGYASHTSTRNIYRPGWAYVSYQTRSGNYPPLWDEVVAVKLDGSGQIERLGHMHTVSGDYNSEAQAVPSPDGKRVLWASNWEASPLRPITALVVDVRDLCRSSLPPTFADVPPVHPYYAEIEALFRAGYTAGCATDPLRYCPEQTMNRGESAVFVERGIHSATYDPPTPTSQVFADLALDSWAAKWVNKLWQDQYTAGCGTNPLVYCPWQGHTRAEGCVFYLRMMNGATYDPPAPAAQTFSDVPLDAWYAKWVKAAYDAGLIPACQTSPGLRFCPNDPLTRAMAAYMMVKAKGLR